jgi:hypothetical protein
MTKYLQIAFTIFALFIGLRLQAANKPKADDYGIMAKHVFSIIELEASRAAYLGIDDSKFTLYINDGILFIKYTKPQELVNAEVYVFNLLGKEIARKRLETNDINEIPIPVQNTCYIIRINYSGKVYTQKVIPSSN